MEEYRHSWYSGEAIVGIALLILGILLFMDNAEMINMGPVWKYWPFILVAVGIGKVFNSSAAKEQVEGAWLAFVGLWLFVCFNHVLGLSFGNSWPLLVIAWGATLLWKGSLGSRRPRTNNGEYHGE